MANSAVHSIRTPDELWERLCGQAEARGVKANALLVALLRSGLDGAMAGAPEPDQRVSQLEAELATVRADLDRERTISAGLRVQLGQTIKAQRSAPADDDQLTDDDAARIAVNRSTTGQRGRSAPETINPLAAKPKGAIEPSQGASKHGRAPLTVTPGRGRIVGYDWKGSPIYR